MDLASNSHLDTLGQAVKLLGVPVSSVRRSMSLNIAAAAAVLRADAISLSPTHRVPATLGGWYGAIAKYSGAGHDIAVMYADAVYRILREGLTATAPTGEVVRIAPAAVAPDTATAAHVGTTPALPANCTSNPGTDYPSAYNCIVPASYTGVTYDTANRPTDLPLLGSPGRSGDRAGPCPATGGGADVGGNDQGAQGGRGGKGEERSGRGKGPA